MLYKNTHYNSQNINPYKVLPLLQKALLLVNSVFTLHAQEDNWFNSCLAKCPGRGALMLARDTSQAPLNISQQAWLVVLNLTNSGAQA